MMISFNIDKSGMATIKKFLELRWVMGQQGKEELSVHLTQCLALISSSRKFHKNFKNMHQNLQTRQKAKSKLNMGNK